MCADLSNTWKCVISPTHVSSFEIIPSLRRNARLHLPQKEIVGAEDGMESCPELLSSGPDHAIDQQPIMQWHHPKQYLDKWDVSEDPPAPESVG